MKVFKFKNAYQGITIYLMFKRTEVFWQFKLPDRRTFKHWFKQAWQKVRLLQFWPVYAVSWGRDCDCVEWTANHKFPTYWHYTKACEEMAANAEGPCSMWIVSKDQYLSFAPEHRDRVMEAFENGRNYSV